MSCIQQKYHPLMNYIVVIDKIPYGICTDIKFNTLI